MAKNEYIDENGLKQIWNRANEVFLVAIPSEDVDDPLAENLHINETSASTKANGG